MLNEYPIIAKNLCFSRGFKKIIDNISLVLKKNEYIGLIGGSGSGKTTLLTCLNGYREHSSGKVLLNGIPIHKKETVRHLIGYVPQDDIVHKNLEIERAFYFSYLLRVKGSENEKITLQKIQNVLEVLDLTKHKHKKISTLSGGQRKRVNIGIELLHSPELFFLDEPTAGLDPALERQMMKFLSDLADQNRLIILTTHLMQNIDLFDILVFIHEGQLIYFGPSSDILPYFDSINMGDLFEKVMKFEPLAWKNRFMSSKLFNEFLLPRLVSCENF